MTTDPHSVTITSIQYADAETRGKLRAWKRKLAERYAVFDKAYREMFEQRSDKSPIGNLVYGTRSTRKQALKRLTQAWGPGATLEWARIDKRGMSIALWSILKPRLSVVGITNKDDPALNQDCVTMNYIVAGKFNPNEQKLNVAEGVWTLEVPDHALGRAVERSRYLTPESLIREAHLTLLNLPLKTPIGEHSSPYIKAGPGCFVGSILYVKYPQKKEASFHMRVKTWLSEDMLHDNQVPLATIAPVGERLGDSILLPRPLLGLAI